MKQIKQLKDNLTLEFIEKEFSWLLQCRFKKAVLGLDLNKQLVWYEGIWEGGTWEFNYIITKKAKKHANADVGFMFIAYNLKRLMNIIGIAKLMAYLEQLILSFTQRFYRKNHYRNPKFRLFLNFT